MVALRIKNLRKIIEKFSCEGLQIELYTVSSALRQLLTVETQRLMKEKNILYKEVIRNFTINQIQWGFEDKARDKNALDSEIAEVKRAIDKLNQERTNSIEEMNKYFYQYLEINLKGKLISESPGSLLDRININHLRKSFLEEFIKNNQDSDLERTKLLDIKSQLDDLYIALEILLNELESGRWKFNIYFHHKLYNDPRYNKFIKTPTPQ